MTSPHTPVDASWLPAPAPSQRDQQHSATMQWVQETSAEILFHHPGSASLSTSVCGDGQCESVTTSQRSKHSEEGSSLENSGNEGPIFERRIHKSLDREASTKSEEKGDGQKQSLDILTKATHQIGENDVHLVAEDEMGKECEILASFDDNGNPKNWGEKEVKRDRVEGSENCGDSAKAPTSVSGSVLPPLATQQRTVPHPLIFPCHPKMQNSLEALGDEPRYFINAAALEGSGEGGERFAALELEKSLSQGIGDQKSIMTQRHGESALIVGNHVNHSSGTIRKIMHKSLSQQEKNNEVQLAGNRVLAQRQRSTNEAAQGSGSVAKVKPRVPVSKSYPDIIQITFVDDGSKEAVLSNEQQLLKANPGTESRDLSANDLTADSLEDLPSKTLWGNHDLIATQTESAKGLNKPEKEHEMNRPRLDDLMDMSQSVSQMGILSEKPPEAWVIDFNSLSMDAEAFANQMETSTNGTRNSNPNSLAFFVNMEKSPVEETGKNGEGGKHYQDKKIFSMFVDFNEQRREDDSLLTSSGMSDASVDSKLGRGISPLPASAKPSRLPVHRNVMTVLRDNDGYTNTNVPPQRAPLGSLPSMSSSTESDKMMLNGSKLKKRTFQYPSPIMQHKAAAEAALKALPSNAVVPKTQKSKDTASAESCQHNPADNAMIHSNRSSLHVATDLDIMAFSSSYISSMEMSTIIAEEPCSKGPCFKLGKDLLRMFQDGVNTDVSICVNGRYLEAHKCILSSRSQYFAAMFSGNSGDVITLDGFSYNVVHFTMCHIYSGTNEIPDTIDLLELATLTDLLGLEGLRENISQTIRVKFCHNFHRPCTGCIAGVLECFQIAISCEMDELHRKMTKWMSKHFVRIWPTKAFANLGEDFIEKSLRYTVNHLSNDNILDITLGCDQLLTTMPSVRWTEPIFSIVNQLSAACVQFIGHNFNQVVQSKRFLLFGKGQQWNISRIEGTFVEALELLTPDEACLSHTALSLLIDLGTETIDEVEWSTMFVDFIRMLSKEVERYLTGNASKVVLSKYWESLSQDVRKRICTSSFLGYDKQGNKITKNVAMKVTSKSATPVERPPSAEGGKSGSKSHSASSNHRASSRAQTEIAKNSSSSPTSSRQPSGSSTGRGHVSTAKIASVKPIQNVLPSPHGKPAPVIGSPAPTEPEVRVPMPKTRAQPSHASTLTSRRRAEVKEKSFSNSPRNSISSTASAVASAVGTPINALTPLVPSKPGPGQGSTSGSTSERSSATTPRNRKPTVPKTVVPPPVETPRNPPRKSFVTNSERANLVSKPTTLRQASTSSLSSRMSSTGSAKDSPTYPSRSSGVTQAAATKPARHSAPERTPIAERSKYSRSSRNNVLSDSEPMENVRTNVGGGARTGKFRDRSNSKTSTRPGVSPSVSSSDNSSRKSSGRQGQGSGKNYAHPTGSDSMNSSSTNVMSRSTIETESGETKIRTLAEIGRSSTFSKDEPTILGKLDPLHTLNIDFS